MVLTTSGGKPVVRSSVVPPMRKLWPVVWGYPSALHTWLHLARKAGLVSMRGPEGVEKASNGRRPASLLVARCDLRCNAGSSSLDCGTRMIFSPSRFIFVRGRKTVWESGLRKERVRCDLAGLETVERSVDEEERSSPRRHCPQNASTAQAAIAASMGCVRSRLSMRSLSMPVVTGGRGGLLEDAGVMFLAPFITTCRRIPPFQGALWALCHALSPESRF